MPHPTALAGTERAHVGSPFVCGIRTPTPSCIHALSSPCPDPQHPSMPWSQRSTHLGRPLRLTQSLTEGRRAHLLSLPFVLSGLKLGELQAQPGQERRVPAQLGPLYRAAWGGRPMLVAGVSAGLTASVWSPLSGRCWFSLPRSPPKATFKPRGHLLPLLFLEAAE